MLRVPLNPSTREIRQSARPECLLSLGQHNIRRSWQPLNEKTFKSLLKGSSPEMPEKSGSTSTTSSTYWARES